MRRTSRGRSYSLTSAGANTKSWRFCIKRGGLQVNRFGKVWQILPAYSAILATPKILENKGVLCHKEQGLGYVFFPSIRREKVQRSLLPHLLHVYFDDSIGELMAMLLDVFSLKLITNELSELADVVEAARKSKAAPRPYRKIEICC